MATYGSCRIMEDENKGVKKPESASRELPIPVYLSLMMLGLWRPSRPRIWSVQWSASGHVTTSLDDGENTKILEHGDTMEMTDYITEAEVWSPEKPQRNKSDYQGLQTADFVFLPVMVTILVLYTVDVYYYTFATWGHEQFVLDTLSYICFVSQTFSIVAYALFTRLSICLRMFCRSPRRVQALPLNTEFIKSRVTFIQQNCDFTGVSNRACLTTWQFLIFLSLPLVNAVGKIAFVIFVFTPRCRFALQHVCNTVESLYFLCYGCFWYLVYVQRISLHCQLNLAVDKIRQLAFKGKNDGTWRLIDRVYSEFQLIRKFTGLWMAYTLFTATVHVVCCVVFSYHDSIYDAVASVESQVSSEPWRETLLKLMLWTQNLMFFVVPCFAVGGANVEYMWHRFRHVLTKCKMKDQLEFWREVQTYVAQIDTLGTTALEWTLAFPFLGATLSVLVQKNYRSLEYWYYRYYCNEIMPYQNISDGL